MSWQNIRRLAKSGYLMLLPIIALAFYIAFIPHTNYPYPVHIDEWVHLTYFKAMLTAGGTTLGGGSTTLESGFHVFWGVFHQLSGLSWPTIFRYFPSIVFMITILSVYVLAHREGFGWEAAFFACLIPTTVGILGPAFLVPVALGLLFIPLSIFLVLNFRNAWSCLTVFIFTCFLLPMHAPSAICLAIILAPFVLLNLRGNFKYSLGLTLALLLPFVLPFPLLFDKLLPTAKELLISQALPTYVDFPQVIKTYGYLPILLCLLGTFLLAIRGGKKNYGLIFGLLALLVMLVTFFTFHYGISIVYERGLIYMMLMVGIVAGAGLAGVKNLSLPVKLTAWLRSPLITQNVGEFLCLVLIGLTLAIGIPDRQDTPYYHMIDEEDYQAFVWIRDNISDDYEKTILDPWKATAFTAITGKDVYTRIHAFPKPSDEKASKFLEEGSSDTTFLRENGISIIYTRGEVHNPDLIEARENIYLLKEIK